MKACSATRNPFEVVLRDVVALRIFVALHPKLSVLLCPKADLVALLNRWNLILHKLNYYIYIYIPFFGGIFRSWHMVPACRSIEPKCHQWHLQSDRSSLYVSSKHGDHVSEWNWFVSVRDTALTFSNLLHKTNRLHRGPHSMFYLSDGILGI